MGRVEKRRILMEKRRGYKGEEVFRGQCYFLCE
jgi:hypothetical protein